MPRGKEGSARYFGCRKPWSWTLPKVLDCYFLLLLGLIHFIYVHSEIASLHTLISCSALWSSSCMCFDPCISIYDQHFRMMFDIYLRVDMLCFFIIMPIGLDFCCLFEFYLLTIIQFRHQILYRSKLNIRIYCLRSFCHKKYYRSHWQKLFTTFRVLLL